MVFASFDPFTRVLGVTFDRPIADFNVASNFEVSSGTLLARWGAGTEMSYTPGNPTMFSDLATDGVTGPGPDVFRWTGDDGPIFFEDGSSLSSIDWTPVTLL